jgi:hypothetical protein
MQLYSLSYSHTALPQARNSQQQQQQQQQQHAARALTTYVVRTEHDVLGGGRLVEVIQEAVVHRVDEELRAAGLGLAGVGLCGKDSDNVKCEM